MKVDKVLDNLKIRNDKLMPISYYTEKINTLLSLVNTILAMLSNNPKLEFKVLKISLAKEVSSYEECMHIIKVIKSFLKKLIERMKNHYDVLIKKNKEIKHQTGKKYIRNKTMSFFAEQRKLLEKTDKKFSLLYNVIKTQYNLSLKQISNLEEEITKRSKELEKAKIPRKILALPSDTINTVIKNSNLDENTKETLKKASEKMKDVEKEVTEKAKKVIKHQNDKAKKAEAVAAKTTGDANVTNNKESAVVYAPFFKRKSTRLLIAIVAGCVSYVFLYGLAKKSGYRGNFINIFEIIKHLFKNFSKFSTPNKIIVLALSGILVAATGYSSYTLITWIIDIFKKRKKD